MPHVIDLLYMIPTRGGGSKCMCCAERYPIASSGITLDGVSPSRGWSPSGRELADEPTLPVHGADVPRIGGEVQRVTRYEHEVRLSPGGDGADPVVDAHELCGRTSRGLEDLQRGHAHLLHQAQFDQVVAVRSRGGVGSHRDADAGLDGVAE